MENYKTLSWYESEIESIHSYLARNYEAAIEIAPLNMFKIVGAPMLPSILFAIKYSRGEFNYHLRELNDFEQFFKTLPKDVGISSRHFDISKRSRVLCKKLQALTKKSLLDIQETEANLTYANNSEAAH